MLPKIHQKASQLPDRLPYPDTRYALRSTDQALSQRELSTDIIDEVQDRIDCLIKPKRLSIQPVSVHLNGVTERLEDKDFFDNIIDYGALVGGA